MLSCIANSRAAAQIHCFCCEIVLEVGRGWRGYRVHHHRQGRRCIFPFSQNDFMLFFWHIKWMKWSLVSWDGKRVTCQVMFCVTAAHCVISSRAVLMKQSRLPLTCYGVEFWTYPCLVSLVFPELFCNHFSYRIKISLPFCLSPPPWFYSPVSQLLYHPCLASPVKLSLSSVMLACLFHIPASLVLVLVICYFGFVCLDYPGIPAANLVLVL